VVLGTISIHRMDTDLPHLHTVTPPNQCRRGEFRGAAAIGRYQLVPHSGLDTALWFRLALNTPV
jgi:hypothetical protein